MINPFTTLPTTKIPDSSLYNRGHWSTKQIMTATNHHHCGTVNEVEQT